MLLVSSSRCHPTGYLEHCEYEIKALLGNPPLKVYFVPYARPNGMSHEEYTEIARKKFDGMGYELASVHEFPNPRKTLEKAEALFIGGGNTFVLLKSLYENNLLDAVKRAVEEGMPYIGSSAGSNVAGQTIETTNDMPIVQPPSLKALGLFPFNINPHYVDRDPDSKHRGETREERINEFHCFSDIPVFAIREDGMLKIDAFAAQLIGKQDAKLFLRGRETEIYKAGDILFFSDLEHLKQP